MNQPKNKVLEDKIKKREIRRINTVRSNREVNRELIKVLVSMKGCTQLTTSTKDWDCEKYPEFGLTKGGQPFCHNPDFLNKCPLINHYFNHGIKQKLKKIIETRN
ncbi:MAG: hypothetical protein Q8K92_08755 [Leadbetterella sp.]|nr:hypothetical protein [Leadbetterella sp.]